MDEEDRRRVVEAARRFAERLSRPVDLDRVHHSWDFLGFDELVAAEEIRAAGGPVIGPAGTSVTLGKALLVGPAENENPWFGQLQLDAQSAGPVRLRSYVL